MDAWLTILTVLSLGYVFFLGQIAIHNCVHNTLFKNTRKLNNIVGNILCSIQLAHFEGWRSAHMMHHRFANTDRDPHKVDRLLVPYILTHYYRIAKRVWEPERFFAATLPPIIVAGTVVMWQALIGEGMRGLRWGTLYWLIPTVISQSLIAHFNYITHVGLLFGRGQDTRSFKKGLWRVINLLTFSFYLHAEHHIKPSEAIPVPHPIFRENEPCDLS